MSIIKNDIPILEYDTSKESVIMPTHEKLGIKLPKKAAFLFLGECVDTYAKENGCKVIAEFISITKKYPVYCVNYKGEEIALCQAPVGSAAAVQILDWLIGYGAEEIISAGSCGVLCDIPENAFLVPGAALRDEGASYHYLPPSRFVSLNADMVCKIKSTLEAKKLKYTECVTWTTDGFYRETADMVAHRKSEGCTVVEMECAALAACAQLRNVKFGQILYTADSLANVKEYDARGFGEASLEKALLLALDILV